MATSRHGVGRQCQAQVPLDVLDAHGVVFGDEEANDCLASGARASDRCRGPDARASAEHALDLAQLDAVAENLDLIVEAPEELEPPFRSPTSAVACGIHPLTLNLRSRVGEEL